MQKLEKWEMLTQVESFEASWEAEGLTQLVVKENDCMICLCGY